jgi:hypothetical protein
VLECGDIRHRRLLLALVLQRVRLRVELAMSDIEHEFVIENDALRAELRRIRDIAERALTAARDAQDTSTGHHDKWLDEALKGIRTASPGRHA